MTGKLSGRRDNNNCIVSTTPDVCLTPVGGDTVPVAYSSIAFLGDAKRISSTVRHNKGYDFQLNSRTPHSTGHEPGTDKGIVKSGYLGPAAVVVASGSVFSEGWPTTRHRDPAVINMKSEGTTEIPRNIKSECQKKVDAIEQETKKVTQINDPIERNKAITAAYNSLAGEDPQNHWIKLASIVSVQGGCNMQKVYPYTNEANQGIPNLENPDADASIRDTMSNMYHALGDANKAIFGDIYPMAAFRARHGFEQMKKCYAATGKKMPPEIESAFKNMDDGKLRNGADDIARYEQMDVVQPVYDNYAGTFMAAGAVNSAQKLATGKNIYDIPVSTVCGDPNTVPFDGDISSGTDRVRYYNKLMDRLSGQMGWPLE